MKVTYDSEADALYIELKATTVTTKRLDQDIAVDYDSEGHIAGIEILSAKQRVFGGLSNGECYWRIYAQGDLSLFFSLKEGFLAPLFLFFSGWGNEDYRIPARA